MPLLTLKTRTGWHTNEPVAKTFVPQVQALRAGLQFTNGAKLSDLGYTLNTDYGCAAFSLHGRSRLMRYTGHADWDYIYQCADARDPDNSNHMAMIGGGDVLSYEEFHGHLANGKLDTCLLARGALIKPWLPTEIKERRHWDISSSERFDIMKDFVKYGLEHWGSDDKGVENTRRYLLEWQSFLCRYVPVGLLETLPPKINDRPPYFVGRNDLETLMASNLASDWVKLSERLLGPVPQGFTFTPKHKANAYVKLDQ